MGDVTGADGVVVPSMAGARLTGGFWGRMAALHRGPALGHQWTWLEATGAIECFEATAGRAGAFVGRDFTSDSDVHKWLDAVARVPPADRGPELDARFESVLALVEATQAEDGYCNTWIQGLFPDGRFRNLETEHEHYTFGHLVEAAVSHHEVTGHDRFLALGRRSADLLVRELADAPAHHSVGHEGLEIALVRLHRATGERAYLDLARDLVERRGRASAVRLRFVACILRTAGRLGHQARLRRRHRRDHPDARRPPKVPGLQAAITPAIAARTAASFVSGRWAQTDRPVRDLVEPSGHAVCFQYLHTAIAMLARDLGDDTLRAATSAAWDRLVQAHLHVNGGAGALPGLEGFGEPYDLDPDRAYAETCASLAGTFWNRELGLLTGEARHDDLLEWQLLNGVAVGTNVDGTAYHYNNPLRAPRGFSRRPWYPIPCCPSNLSRTWASLATLQLSRVGDELRLHQYFSSEVRLGGLTVEVDSGLPWSGDVVVRVASGVSGVPGVAGDAGDRPGRLAFRVPSWAADVTVGVDGSAVVPDVDARPSPRATASGLDPWQARWARVDLPAGAATDGATEVRISFGLPVRFLAQDPRVPEVGGRVAVARGPLLYCLEGVDHPELADSVRWDPTLDRTSVTERFDPDLLGGAVELRAATTEGRPLRFVPYFLWGNRGAEGMTAFVR